MRTWIVAGNWKMHNTIGESITLSQAIKEGTTKIKNGEVVIAPPFTSLGNVYETIKGSKVSLAAQNMHYEDKGAFTGEIAPGMLKDIGCTYVIIGHSERRKYFHERDEDINLKVKKALAVGLKPILCVGETEDERIKGVTKVVIDQQIKKALSGVDKIDNVVIAYEPVWAIGTGLTATPEMAEEAHHFIRHTLSELYDLHHASGIRILYGGSVKPENIQSLMKEKDLDGALVGGASLEVSSFEKIVNFS